MATPAEQRILKRRAQLLEMKRKGYTDDFIKFAFFANDPTADIGTDLETINSLTGQSESNQVEVGGRKFAVDTITEQKTYQELKAGETQQANMKESAKTDLGTKLSTLDELMQDQEGLSAAVGANPLARPFTPISGAKQRFAGKLESILSTDTLDSLIKAKAEGATFGALSDAELNLLRASASTLAQWAVKDGDGKIVGFDASEEDVKKELANLRATTAKAFEDINAETGGTTAPAKPKVSDPAAVQAWLDANPTDPRAEQVRKLLEEQNIPLGDSTAQESSAVNETQEKPGVLDAFGETGTALMGRVKNIFAEASDRPDSVRDVVANVFGEKQLRMLGQLAGGVGDLFVGATKVAYRSLDEDKRKAIEDGAQDILSTETGQAGLKALGQGVEAYQTWKEANPDAAKDIEAIGNIASVIPIGKLTNVAGREVKNIVGDVSRIKGGFAKTDDIIKAQVEAGLRPDIDPATLSKGAKSQIDEAVKQGFEERDVKFLATMAPEDRTIAGQMLSLADEANASPRVLRRPIDLAGETLTSKVKTVTDKVSEYGKQVDIEAKNLRGITINSTELGASARQALEAIGVKVKGKTLDFKGSVFKMTPQIQATVKKFFQEIPGDTTDAYQLHIFKKSIDELVTYGSQGEGLKGSAERLLKGLRKSADDILDNSFDGYKMANEQFREAKQIADSALDLFGKKNGVKSSVRGGQVLRGAFSNNQTRAKVYELAEMLDNYEKKLFGKTTGNALDQAMFAEILEKSSLFKTQAITGFAGGIESAVGKAIDAVDIVRNPIRGGLNAAAAGIEKMRNLTPDGKRKALESLLKGILIEKKPVEFKSRLFNFNGKAGMSTVSTETRDGLSAAIEQTQKNLATAEARGNKGHAKILRKALDDLYKKRGSM